MHSLDSLFIGSSTKDILMLVNAPPASDQRIAASYFTTACGGVSSTAAAAHQSLGGITGIITAVGDDETSNFITDDLQRQNFQYLKLFAIKDHYSSTSMIQVEQDGRRCLTCFGGCIEKLTFPMIDKNILKSSRIIHLGVMNPETMLELCAYCKKHTEALISIDGGNIPKDLALELLPYADFYIPDNKTAMSTLGLMPKEACYFYVEKGAGFACVTSAESGSCACDGKTFYQEETIPVRVMDTTGAGDNFHGAFLYCINQGWDYGRSMRFSNIFASLSCEGLGGRAAIPPMEKVMEFMKNKAAVTPPHTLQEI